MHHAHCKLHECNARSRKDEQNSVVHFRIPFVELGNAAQRLGKDEHAVFVSLYDEQVLHFHRILELYPDSVEKRYSAKVKL